MSRSTAPLLGTICGLTLVLLPLAQADPGPAPRPTLDIIVDFVEAFQPQFAANATVATATSNERCNQVPLPGIFLHPQGLEDAVVTFAEIAVPDTPDPVFLLTRLGMRDDIPWDSGQANGVRFSLFINDQNVLDEVRDASRWTSRAVDMSPWKGQTVSVAFHTNAIDGNTAYDWGVWGDPILAVVRNPASTPTPGDPGNGVLFVQIEAAQALDLTVKVGERGTRINVAAGTHWIPVHFASYEEPALQVAGGAVAEKRRIIAYYPAAVTVTSLESSTPLVHINDPFNIILTVRNTGRGVLANHQFSLADYADPAQLAGLGDGALQPIALEEPLNPNEVLRVVWQGLTAADAAVHVLGAFSEFSVVAPPPPLPPDRPLESAPAILPDLPQDLAIVANPWSRVTLVAGGPAGTEYWIAETWNGEAWQRLGSLSPWVRTLIQGPGGAPEHLLFLIRQIARNDAALYIDATATDAAGRPWQLRVEAAPAIEAARIRLKYQLTCPDGGAVLAFYGPIVAAGDKAFGIEKDYALFPGVEYLEGTEESSSTRDLAYPLSDRRVPAIHKIATPLMAVQGQGGLLALLWDPKQAWAADHPYPSARFNAPAEDSSYTSATLALFAPSVGAYVPENTYIARTPYMTTANQVLTLDAWLVLDHVANYDATSVARGPHPGGLILQAMQHYFEAYGIPAPSAPPRDWETQKALCRDGYYHAVWHPEFPGWSHCHNWEPGDLVGHCVPLIMDMRDAASPEVVQESTTRINRVIDHAVTAQSPGYLWNGAGCHIMLGELPFYVGHLGEAMAAFRDHGLQNIAARENGMWVWRPGDEKYQSLGVTGDHTLGQAALPSYRALRAARMTGDGTLLAQSLDAMKQMALYDIPRGAQTWECPLYQPDILAAAHAIRAYTEAYRITGDPVHLDHARYWAWTGLPFLYLWDMPGYPTMRYNVISVIGSTFYTHSWIGLPVVWCGLVYAYALQDLAEFDDSFEWKTIATGITHSAMHQQYVEGPNRGTYPDSWNMIENKPNPADINPENIMVNMFRLAGVSPEIRFFRWDTPAGAVVFNTSADIVDKSGTPGAATLSLTLRGFPGADSYALLGPVAPPVAVNFPQAADEVALQALETGWLYSEPLHAVILKIRHTADPAVVTLNW